MLWTSWTTQRSTDAGSDLLKIDPGSTADLDLAAAPAPDLAADAERAAPAAGPGAPVAGPVAPGPTATPEAGPAASPGQGQSQAAKSGNQNHKTRKRVMSRNHPSQDLAPDQHLGPSPDQNLDPGQNQGLEHLMIGVNQMLLQRRMEMRR